MTEQATIPQMRCSRYTVPSLLYRIWRLVSSRRRVQVGWLFVLMVGASLAEVISIGTVIPFLGALVAPERVFDHRYTQMFVKVLNLAEPADLLLPITVFFCCTTLFAVSMRLTLAWVQMRLSAAMATELSAQAYLHILHQPYSFHTARNSSEMLAGVSKAGEMGNMLVMPSLTFLSSSFLLCMILMALMVIDVFVAMSAFVGFAAIYATIALLTKKRLGTDSRRINSESEHMIQALQEGLGGIRDVLIDGTQKVFTDIYSKACARFRYSVASVSIVSQSPRFLVEAMGMWLIATIAYCLSTTEEGLQRAIPVLGALAMGAQRMLPALQQSYASLITMRGNNDSVLAALDMLEQPMPQIDPDTAVAPQPFKEKISLRHLGFRYTLDAPWVLRGIDLDIPRGSKIGFIGATGSGKSTLLDIIMGLLAPGQGELQVDGQAITPKNLRAWQAHIAHVPQAIYLSDGTIAENIAFGVPKARIDMERVQQAAHQAQIGATIEGWKDQYRTIVGERGVRLSGGQRQRIGIARALYKQADVIIFDEATSALDNDTELEVMQAIETLGEEVTVLIIAHRLTTLRMCSQVVELANGGVQRAGSYKEIIQTV